MKDWPADGTPLTLPALKGQLIRAYILNDADKKPLKIVRQENEWSLVVTGTKPEQPFTVITFEIDGALAATK